MAENELPIPPKRRRGRPLKHAPLPEIIPEVAAVTAELTEPLPEVDSTPLADTSEDGFGLARTVVENPNDLAGPEKSEIDFAPPLEKFLLAAREAKERARRAEQDRDASDGDVLPSGDVELKLVIREQYAQAMQDMAAERSQSLNQAMQEMLDWWVEQEFATIRR